MFAILSVPKSTVNNAATCYLSTTTEYSEVCLGRLICSTLGQSHNGSSCILPITTNRTIIYKQTGDITMSSFSLYAAQYRRVGTNC